MFDAITAAASQVCGTPIALISLIDAGRQWFKAKVGLAGGNETPRDQAFCDHAIRDAQALDAQVLDASVPEAPLLEVEDACLDARFAANPFVTGEPHIRFYAGAVIVMPGGERVGTVCVTDREPRRLTEWQRTTLQGLARIASAALVARAQQEATKRRLAANETRYRAIVEDQTELISLAGADRVISFVNAAYAKHFGLSPDQMVGHDLLDFVSEIDRPAVAAHWAQVCTQTETLVSVNRMQVGSSPSRWVAWSNRPLVDGTHVIAVQSVGRDITEQKLAEIALFESEQRFRRLYESTPAILHSVDAEGRLLNVSDLWLQTLGYERHEVIGAKTTDFLTPASRERALNHVLPEFFRSGRCDNVDYQFVRKDGGVIDILLSASAERDAGGIPVRSMTVLLDVTETKRMADELRRAHARLDAVVENMPALLGHWDRDQITRLANRAFQAAVGLPHDQMIGAPLKAIFDAIDPVACEALTPHVAQVLQGRRQEFELAMLTTSGLRQLQLTLVPDQSLAGQVAGFYAMAYDITGRKALELRLLESEQRYRARFDNLSSGFDGDGTPQPPMSSSKPED